MPEYVKSANVLSSDEAAKLDSSLFADSIGRSFPLNTKANCWCSAVYFYGNQYNKDPQTKQAEINLEKAAVIWGIEEDLAKIKLAFAEETVPVTYALSFSYKNTTINRCPDHTKAAATASAQWLYENRFKFPLEAQKAAAVKLQTKADLLKVSTSAATYIDRLANSDAYSNLNCKVASAITDRLNSVPAKKWNELEDTLLKVANTLAAAPFELCADGHVIVQALESFDVKHGLNEKWGSALQHPVDCCFKMNICKVAASTDSIVHLTTGTPVDLTKISDHQLEKGLKIAGDDFLSYCQTDGLNVDRSKAAEILPTLPKPEAKRFETAIKSAGYVPETTYDLIDRISKESNQLESAMMTLQQAMPNNKKDDLPQPEPWEDNAAFESRMQQQKEEARIATLDAQAGIAAAKARQARQEKIVNPNAAAPAPEQVKP